MTASIARPACPWRKRCSSISMAAITGAGTTTPGTDPAGIGAVMLIVLAGAGAALTAGAAGAADRAGGEAIAEGGTVAAGMAVDSTVAGMAEAKAAAMEAIASSRFRVQEKPLNVRERTFNRRLNLPKGRALKLLLVKRDAIEGRNGS